MVTWVGRQRWRPPRCGAPHLSGISRRNSMTIHRAKIVTLGAGGFALALLPAVAQAQRPPRALPPCTFPNQTVGLTLNTGTAGPNPPPGVADPIWIMISPPSDVYSTTRGSWFAPFPGSRWIQPVKNGNPFPI